VFEGDLYLLVVDHYSRWIEALPIPAQTASVVIKTMKSVLSRLGVPENIRSDNGPCYSCHEFGSFAREWGFVHITSSPRYPQSNGMAKRAVGTVKRLWRKCNDKDRAL
jgi:transposase InsO family protein